MGWARAYFEGVSQDVKERRCCLVTITYGVPKREGGGEYSCDHSPTESAAIASMGASRKVKELDRSIAQAKRLLKGLHELDADGAQALSLRYLHLLTLGQIGERLGCDKSTVSRRCDRAFDECDAWGYERVMAGVGFAEQ